MSKTTRDRFGSKSDTKCAKINACFGKKPIDRKTIAKRTKLNPGFVASHVRTLLKKRLVREREEGLVVRKVVVSE